MQFVLKSSYIILFVFLFCNFSYCSNLDTLDIDKNPDVALFLSLLPLLNVAEPNEVLTIPSLGQLYNEKPLKAFILSAMKSYWLMDYDKSKKDSDIKDRNRSLWWLFGLIMYGAIDAYTDANLDKFNKNYKE
tara:strand:+ start:1373 stop:1768 length:396 start_codon:yes stop_codon:yes gene_type:complete